ncbi:Protein of unknown function [Nocardia amikacinitolerans]|uniref:DUF3558 domain-containing protein n=1 Tax=Nocardia amikacinitolerans TaxID=756689 RepID=A0A285L8M6_9NOCA|nr:DUF3558 domain-containing protein [Nocardia amikacinitolerans]SNY81242.1 Protein of unknown function [Nocardia amikacinitolerans]
MTSRATSLGIAAMACGAVMLLAGCGGTSVDSSQTPSGTTSVTASSTTSAAGRDEGGATPATPDKGDTESNGPAPTQAEDKPSTPTNAEGSSPAPTPAESRIWDPCTLPESDLTAAGLNTATKERITDATYPSWQMCRWKSADQTFSVVIAASDRTIDDLLEPGAVHDVRRTEFHGRQVVQYRYVADTHRQTCDIGTPAEYGSIVFAVRNIRVQTDVGNPCQDANRLGAALFRSLP